MKHTLYGDGIHDDLPAIQEMLDSGVHCVYLPEPKNCYVINGSIRLNSNQELKLDRYTRVKLGDWVNTTMITNADPVGTNENLAVTGGIWDMNHANQKMNPAHFPDPDTGLKHGEWREKTGYDRNCTYMPDVYIGFCFIFNHCKNLKIRDLTIENPVTYGMDISYTEDFTIENIDFDYTEGSPRLWNLDGIHVDGGCKNGLIRNLHGACHDDMVAITSDDYLYGPIENITVDGIYAYGSHSAVRLLSERNAVKNINISNIYGTYYVYCIVMDKYIKSDYRSAFDNINISNVFASMCKETEDNAYWKSMNPGTLYDKRRPLIVLGPDLDVNMLTFSNIYRDETHVATPTFGVQQGTHIRNLFISSCSQTNTTGDPLAFVEVQGKIDNLYLCNIDTHGDPLLTGEENVGQVIKSMIL